MLQGLIGDSHVQLPQAPLVISQCPPQQLLYLSRGEGLEGIDTTAGTQGGGQGEKRILSGSSD